MNARMKTSGRPGVSLFVIASAPDQDRRGLPEGTWIRLQRALGRLTLLMSSPIASFRWARAKRRAAARRNGTQVSGSHSHAADVGNDEGLGLLSF